MPWSVLLTPLEDREVTVSEVTVRLGWTVSERCELCFRVCCWLLFSAQSAIFKCILKAPICHVVVGCLKQGLVTSSSVHLCHSSDHDISKVQKIFQACAWCFGVSSHLSLSPSIHWAAFLGSNGMFGHLYMFSVYFRTECLSQARGLLCVSTDQSYLTCKRSFFSGSGMKNALSCLSEKNSPIFEGGTG